MKWLFTYSFICLSDERFRGYGHDKEAHIYELAKAGYEFFVLPSVFVVHVHHPDTAWKTASDWVY